MCIFRLETGFTWIEFRSTAILLQRIWKEVYVEQNCR
jgi:hypothetical protein